MRSIGRDDAECFPCSARFLLRDAGHHLPLALPDFLTVCLWLCNCVLLPPGHPLWGLIWAPASMWSSENFLVLLRAVASGRSVPSPIILCAWRHWVWIRVVERMCFIAREAQYLHAPSSHVVVFLNLMILKGAEEEQTQ